MALKHLKNALELLNAGMSISDIKDIIAMKDEPEQIVETPPAEPEQEEETQDEPEHEQKTETEKEPVTEPEQKEVEIKPKKNPYQEKSENHSSPENLVQELNKLF